MKLKDARGLYRGSGCSPFPNADRQERWGFLTENLKEACTGVTRTDAAAVAEKQIIVENCLDQMLRFHEIEGGDGTAMAHQDSVQGLYEGLMGDLESSLTEDTTMGYTATGSTPSTAKVFTTQSLGMVRRIFPRMIATDLISVQPISQPTGKVFYLDIEYDANAGGNVDANDRVDDNSAWDYSGERDYASYTGNAGVNTNEAIVEGATAREINLDISSVDVTSITKKLAAEWSVEVQQDLRSYHGLDADGELSAATSGEITREIDRTLIEFIRTTARDSGAGVTYWNKNGYAGAVPSEQKAWDETLWDAIEDGAALIEGARYRRPTWLLCNHNTASRIRKLNGFQSNATGNDLQIQTGGRRLFGTLQNTFYVYVDPWFDEDVIVLGYKGNAFFEAGIVYSPYIPFFRTPLFTNPVTFMNQRGIMSRFARTAVIGDMYARVVITST